MTTLQEAIDIADIIAGALQVSRGTAYDLMRSALAQQGEQQPVAWYEYNQDLDAWFLAYGHNPKAKTRPLVFGDTAAPAPQAPFNETDAAMWLTKNKNTLHETLSTPQPAQGELAEIARLHDRIKDLEADVEYLQSAQPVAQLTDAAIREIADCIVSNLDSRKGVIDLDLDDDMVEEIMQEMCDTIAHGIREAK